ncbi:MAG: hypothetical protein IPO92_22455 [Saprospiraceae bacterium]|nr:hypothetical protein [Saprospiraceae bacterium]
MIKFFRHIRQKLIAEGKLVNYLKYVIGEIVLVMIGILLAVQLNNWNENRKNRIFEKEILSQIRSNLEKNKENLNGIKNTRQRAC